MFNVAFSAARRLSLLPHNTPQPGTALRLWLIHSSVRAVGKSSWKISDGHSPHRTLRWRRPAGAALLAASAAHADIVISAGYYDLAPPASGNPNALPDPWYGSANTAFFGSVSRATSSDPDEFAVLIQNTGASAITLNAGASFGGATSWDSFIGTGFSIAAGSSVILTGVDSGDLDGSDYSPGSLVSLTLNGKTHVFDAGSIFGGYPAFNETIAWTPIGTVNTSAAPEPAAWALMMLGVGGMGAALRSRRRAVAA